MTTKPAVDDARVREIKERIAAEDALIVATMPNTPRAMWPQKRHEIAIKVCTDNVQCVADRAYLLQLVADQDAELKRLRSDAGQSESRRVENAVLNGLLSACVPRMNHGEPVDDGSTRICASSRHSEWTCDCGLDALLIEIQAAVKGEG